MIRYFFPTINILLQVGFLVLLLRGPLRRYLFLFLYCVAQLGTLLLTATVIYRAGVQSLLYRDVYWTTDVMLDLLRFFMVIAITLKVMEGNPLRVSVGRMLLLIGAAAVVLPFVLYHPFFSSRWFRHTSQLLSLGGAVMNLFLWGAIIGKRDRDPQLLLVSAGLGVAVTGVAITYGLLQFASAGLRWLPDVFKSMALLAGMLIWCWAFWPAARARSEQAPALTGSA